MVSPQTLAPKVKNNATNLITNLSLLEFPGSL